MGLRNESSKLASNHITVVDAPLGTACVSACGQVREFDAELLRAMSVECRSHVVRLCSNDHPQVDLSAQEAWFGLLHGVRRLKLGQIS
jgi:hypothetical protein